jgi:DNA repair photolyase
VIESATSACDLRPRSTDFVDLFRTTPPQTVCPNFYVLCHANGCLFEPNCSYCYLRSSLWHLPRPQAFSNVEAMLEQVRAWIARDGLETYVLNTGNLSDSLAFEDVRPAVGALVELFRREAAGKGRPHELLLVTKGGPAQCRGLLEIEPCRSVIVSFSVNSRRAARRHEKGAAPVGQRLLAARKLARRGWRVRMRIDPMILGYDYAWVIEQLRRLAPERVTLGALRAEPGLLHVLKNPLFAALEPPAGSKAMARYPRAERIALYRPAVAALSAVCPVALCEETEDVWRELGLDVEGRHCNCGA